MEKNRSDLTEKMLNLTMELICLLTGEDYIIVKKTSGDHVTPSSYPHVSGGWSRSQRPDLEPSSQSSISDKNIKLLLDVINKITELLTGKVPISCQDVAVYFSMEEWEFIEGHKDLYKDFVMEDLLSLTSSDPDDTRATQKKVNANEEEEQHVKIKEEEIPPEISTDPGGTTDTQRDIEDEEEEGHVRFKEEDIPVEISTDPGYAQGDMKAEETEEECVWIKEEEIPIEISLDGNYNINSMEKSPVIIGPDGEEEDITASHFASEIYIPPYFHSLLYSTDLCSISATNSGTFSDSSQPTALRGSKTIPCPKRGKCVSERAEFASRQRTHKVKKPHTCSKCGKCFKQKWSLSRHERSHTGEKSFSCLKCGRGFTRKASLIRHEWLHTGVKPYSCSECGKSFIDKWHLIGHQKTHASEKTVSCSECGKSYSQRRALTLHQRTHTGVKPYSCSECGKYFAQKCHVARHQRCHMGEKQFFCTLCGKCFTQKHSLLSHELTHVGVKPFSCLECGKCFTDRSYLLKHQKIHT